MNAPELRVVGTRARRIEDPALLRGEGRFVDDIVVPDMLHGAFLRSPYAHARILRIDTTAAKALPGVNAVLLASDLDTVLKEKRMPPGFPGGTLPANITPYVLSWDEVAYAGEPFALVLATSRGIAEDATALIDVEFEPLPVIADCRDAVKPSSPKVRREVESNILQHLKLGYGDTNAVFASAPHVFRESIRQHRGAAHPMEGRGVLAKPGTDDSALTVWTSSQMTNEVFTAIVDMLGIDENRLRVIAPDVGGGFGCKYVVTSEEIAVSAAAVLTGRPVKWIEDRREHFLGSIQERDQQWDVEIAVASDGKILGIRGTMIHDHGAYTPQGTNAAYNAASSVTGPYIVPAYALEVFVVQTNKVPVIPVRGAGYPQASYTMERLLDRAAKELGIARDEIRRRNFIPSSKMPYTKQLKNRAGASMTIDSGDYAACQEMALKAIGYADFGKRQVAARAEGRHIGIGLSHCVKPTGRGPFESGRVQITPSGKVSVYTGALAMGQGLKTCLAMICSEQLGVPIDSIEVIAGDTSFSNYGMGGFASRQTIMAGSSVHLAAVEVKNKAIKVAAGLLEAAEEDLVLRNGRVELVGVPGSGLPLADIARKLKGAPGFSMPGGVTPGLEANANFQIDLQAYANACHVCEVEVDTGTGQVRILRYIAVQDSGKLINPMAAEGQVHGGVVHGIGNALFEWMRYDEEAQPITTTFADYLMVTATEIPNIEVLFHESPSPINPLGVKGIGEAGTLPVVAAIISATEDALSPFGVHIAEAPLTPVRVLELIDLAQGITHS